MTAFQMTREALERAAWFPRDEYPFASHSLEVDGGAMHYLDERSEVARGGNPAGFAGRAGDGPVVLLVHGTPSWSFEFRGVIARLRERHRCVAPDHLGFGLSARPAPGLGLAAHAANLARLVDHLGLDRVHLVVHDFGGPIALPLLETLGKRIERVTILNSWLWPFEDVDPAFARQKRWVDTAVMRFLYLRLSFSARMMVKLAWGKRVPLDRARHDHYRKMFPNAASRRGTWALAQATVHSKAYYDAHAGVIAELRARPVQLVWGCADRFIHTRHLARWRELVPDARVIELADVGHFVADEAPADVAAAITGFA